MARSKLQDKLAKRQAAEAALQKLIQTPYRREKKSKRNKQLSGDSLAGRLDLESLECTLLNQPQDYKPRSCNYDRQVREFIKFTLCRYVVPRFMFQTWFWNDHPDEEKRHRQWFVCMAQGGSLYKKHAKGMLSKAETADFVRDSDNRLSIEQNIWRAKLKGMGATQEYAKLIVTSRFSNVAHHDEFWNSVARFFVAHNVPRSEMNELIDFLRNIHLDDENFSLKGRTLQSVTKLSNEWHEEQIRKQSKYGKSWEGMGIEPWTYSTKFTPPGDNKRMSRLYTIEEITNSKSLFAEGRNMGHCVGSYVRDCENSTSSIFKMESVDEFQGFKKHLTIQVRRTSRSVAQARGKHNERPTKAQQNVLGAWMKKHQFTQTRYSWF